MPWRGEAAYELVAVDRTAAVGVDGIEKGGELGAAGEERKELERKDV